MRRGTRLDAWVAMGQFLIHPFELILQDFLLLLLFQLHYDWLFQLHYYWLRWLLRLSLNLLSFWWLLLSFKYFLRCVIINFLRLIRYLFKRLLTFIIDIVARSELASIARRKILAEGRRLIFQLLHCLFFDLNSFLHAVECVHFPSFPISDLRVNCLVLCLNGPRFGMMLRRNRAVILQLFALCMLSEFLLLSILDRSSLLFYFAFFDLSLE